MALIKDDIVFAAVVTAPVPSPVSVPPLPIVKMTVLLPSVLSEPTELVMVRVPPLASTSLMLLASIEPEPLPTLTEASPAAVPVENELGAMVWAATSVALAIDNAVSVVATAPAWTVSPPELASTDPVKSKFLPPVLITFPM